MKQFLKIKHMFEDGGRFERLYPVYEMLFSLLFDSPEKTVSGSHIRDHYNIKRMMVSVIIAMVPVSVFGMYNTGLQHYLSMGETAGFMDCFIFGALKVVPLFIVVYAVGGFWEILFAVIRKHEINEGLLVTGFILPLILPPAIPLWQAALATTFGVVIGKEVFGGTGMNVFNPAMIARAFLFFAYPASMSGQSVWVISGERAVDSFTMATPLSIISSGAGLSAVDRLSAGGYTFGNMFIGFIPGSIGETSTLLILLGGLFLMVNRVASWRIILSVFTGGLAMGIILNIAAPSHSSIMALPAYYHPVMGGFAFGAVFMATDPVSAAATSQGKYVYGFFIGVLAVLVRALNPAYPEGMMLSILFMNAFAPLIDHIAVVRNIKRRKKSVTQ